MNEQEKEKTARDIWDEWAVKVNDHDSLVDALWEFMDYPEPERDYRKALDDIDDGSVTGDFEEFLAEHYSKDEETKNYLVRRVEYWHVQAVDEAEAICNYAGGEHNRLDEEAFDFTVKPDEDIKDAISRTIRSL